MLISKRAFLSQVQKKSCGHFSCQVRNLFLCVASIENTNNNKHCIKFIRQYHSRSLNNKHSATTLNSFYFYSNRNYSRFSANNILTGTAMMKFTDYDCIGFDLDNTLVSSWSSPTLLSKYRITKSIQLVLQLQLQVVALQTHRNGWAGVQCAGTFSHQYERLFEQIPNSSHAR